jgi:hypothetical protein
LLDDPSIEKSDSRTRTVSRSYWGNATSIRTQTHRLIVWDNAKKQHVELYDVTRSPDPEDNLADSRPDLVKQLALQLNSTDPLGAIGNDNSR